MQKGRAKNGNARCFFFFSPSSLGASMSCWLLLALVLAKTMDISSSEDEHEAACQTHKECSEERVARAVHTINSARAGICEARGEEGHMLGAGRCEWHVCVARRARCAGRCSAGHSERVSATRASESAPGSGEERAAFWFASDLLFTA